MGARAFVAVGIFTAGAAGATAARAEPQLSASGFIGVGWFGKHTELGNSWAPEQVPGTAPVVGGRLSWLALPTLPGGLQLGAEVEAAFASSFTGDNALAGRMAYFAPVIEWRAHAVLRLARWRGVVPHVVLGVGGATVTSASPFLSSETDPVAYWGPGVSVPVSERWQLRVDLRHGLMPARDGGVQSTVELALGIGTTFGAAARTAPPRAEPPPPPPPLDNADRDGDGIPDRLDACPDQAETVNGVADDDGCPEPDPDGDGLVGDADHCPDQAEDFDGFEDTDGCPEPDNDHDGIEDARDACPSAPETRNGFDDDDGCPDQVPADVTAALGARIRLEPGRARVTAAAAAALRPLLAALQAYPKLRIAIVGHPERAGGDDLARRRAEAVKWYLVDQGVIEDRLVTRAGDVASAPPVRFELVVEPMPAPAPMPQPAPPPPPAP